MSIGLLSLFADKATREIFDVVASQRKVRFKDLWESLNLEPQVVRQKLLQLKGARLIDSTDAPLTDFETFYVTADGLSAERQLRRLKSSTAAVL